MAHKTLTRRALVPSLAALPLAATLFPPLQMAAQVTRAILFKGSSPGAVPGRENWVFGWVAETSDGWTGLGSDWSIAIAEQDLPGSAAFAGTVIVPKGTPNTVNGAVNNGVRASVTCYWDINEVTLLVPYFKLTGILRMMDNPAIFVPGDPVSVEGNADAGEFTWTIRGAGQDRGPSNYTGQILILGNGD